MLIHIYPYFVAVQYIDLTKPQKATRKGEMTWTLESDTTIFGFAYWWTADLVPGVTLSTGPSEPRTHWEQLYFPLLALPLANLSAKRVAHQTGSMKFL